MFEIPRLAISGKDLLFGNCILDIIIDVSNIQSAHVGIANMAQVFALAGKYGAFASSSNNNFETLVKYQGLEFIEPTSIVVKLVTTNIDFKSFQYFRNMLIKLQTNDVHASRILVQVESYTEMEAVEVPVITDLNEAEVYPSKIILLEKPEIIWNDSEFSKSRRVLIELDNLLTKRQLKELTNYISAWYQLLERGAFAMPVGLPFETESCRGRISIFDEVTYEISIERYMASEVGFVVLVNMLIHFSRNRNIWQINKIEID